MIKKILFVKNSDWLYCFWEPLCSYRRNQKKKTIYIDWTTVNRKSCIFYYLMKYGEAIFCMYNLYRIVHYFKFNNVNKSSKKNHLFYSNSFFSLVMCWRSFCSFRHLRPSNFHHDGQLSQDYIELYYSHCNPVIYPAHQWCLVCFAIPTKVQKWFAELRFW